MTTKQIKFMAELLKNGTISAAIRETGISSSTAYKWMKDPAFRSELQSKRTEMLREVSMTMQAGFSKAVQELVEIIKNDCVSAQTKVNAIDCLFRNARPIIEEVDILNRLNELEAAMTTGDEDE